MQYSFLLVLFSLIYTENVSKGLVILQRNIYFVLFALIIFSYEKQTKNLIKAFSFGTVAVCVLALLTVLVKIIINKGFYFEVGDYRYKEYYFLYSNLSSNVFLDPSYLSFMNLIALFFFIYNYKKKYIVYMILIFIVTILLSSKITYITLIFFGVLEIIKGVKYSKNKIYLLISGLFIFGIIFIKLIDTEFVKGRFIKDLNFELPNYDKTHHTYWNSSTQRIAIWDCTFQVIQENLFFGVGYGDAEDEMLKIYNEKGFKRGVIFQFNTHNQYLQILLCSGIIGFLAIGVFFITPLFILKDFRGFFFQVLIMFSIWGISESYLQREQGIIILASLIPLFYKKNLP